jgi:hypothetical protein
MVNIANVIRGMDKRMSYNLRLMGSVMMKDEPGQYQEFDNQGAEKQQQTNPTGDNEVMQILNSKSITERKETVIPKIKKMSEFTANKLDMKSEQDLAQIANVKKKLKSIDQTELKAKVMKQGLGNFVVEQYFKDNNVTVNQKTFDE